jgi:hypothetical protein
MFRVQIKHLVSGKVSEVSISTLFPDQSNKLVSENQALLRELAAEFGLRHSIGQGTSPRELIACLKRFQAEDVPKYSYEVIAGAEILEIPEAALPEGAIP